MNKKIVIDSLFTSMARAEEKLHPNAVLLDNFPRRIQRNSYSCGAISVFIILEYFGISVSYNKVFRLLGTDQDGTAAWDIKNTLKKYGLRVKTNAQMTVRNLKTAIDSESPVLISICLDEHYAVVYGYSRNHIFVMNSSLDASDEGVGSIKVAVPRRDFLDYWDRWGIIVSRKK
jgi:ABC-type bacteriocin/lantibiotic exporter with double-glycine peptidase domain